MFSSMDHSQTGQLAAPLTADLLVAAGNIVERMLAADSTFPSLLEATKVSQHCLHTASGLNDMDYVSLDAVLPAAKVKQIQSVRRVPLPREISQHTRASHFHSKQGLFPDIHRAWMTIDSDLYLWSYDQGVDTAFYDRLTETIVGVAIVKPRVGVFQPYVRRLLVAVTCAEVVILGVTFSAGPAGNELLNLIPEPVFQLATDSVAVTATVGTEDGRIFQGGDDGCLYEICYKGNEGWFGKSCRRVNHSQGFLSVLVPSFLNLADKDSIVQLVVDNSRNLLYALTSKGSVRAYQLGADSVNLLATISEASLVQQAVNVVRTLDGSTFRPVVALQAIEASDSSHLHVVGVTAAGVRLYMTTLSMGALVGIGGASQWAAQPQGLHLVHVRMPPGYAGGGGGMPTPQLQQTTTALYRRGCLLAVQKRGESCAIACWGRDLLPGSAHLAETDARLQLDDQVLELAEQPPPHPSPREPLIVTQHMEQQTRYVALSNQGVTLMTKLRPQDVLKAALLAGGAEGLATKGLFCFLGEEQACATALVLACFEPSQNIVDEATRAFLMLGAERRTAAAPAPLTPILFNPSSVSTPIRAPMQMTLSSGGVSARHEGLYLMVSRILRPLWSINVSRQVATDNNKLVLSGNCDTELVAAVCTYLEALSSFLRRNMHLLVRSNQNDTQAEAEEKKSLDALKQLVFHSLEVLGLWRIVSEHQLHVLAPHLSLDLQKRLPSINFKELILSGHEVCAGLLGGIISFYLADDATVDAISAKLRNTCPTLFRSEDSAAAKAKQLLQQAQQEGEDGGKHTLVAAALRLMQEAAPHVDLPTACQQLLALQSYEGVIRVCAACAKAVDPYDLGLKQYKNELTAEEAMGAECLRRRSEAYREVVNALDKLYGQSEGHLGGRTLLQAGLQQHDPLLREAIYEWLLVKGLMQPELLQRSDPPPEGLEVFLQRLQTQARTDEVMERNVSELLWTLYERSGRHAMAASVLHKAATSSEPNLAINDRIYCLSRGILSLRSTSAGYNQSTGIFNKELEDLLDVAKIQQRIYDEVQAGQHNLSTAQMERLHKTLLSISDLFQQYAVPLQLFECQLKILESSNHEDQNLVNDIWLQMIQKTQPVSALVSRVEAVGTELNKHLVPLELLAKELEAAAVREGASPGLVGTALVRISGLETTLAAYDRLLRQPEWTWGAAGDEHHLMRAAAALLAEAAERGSSGHQVRVLAQDVATSCLNQLYTKTCVEELVGQFRRLQNLFQTVALSP